MRTLRPSIIIVLLLLSVLSCAPKPLIKVDIDTYLKNQSQYKGKNVVVMATLQEVVKNYNLYKGKEIELSAPVTFHGYGVFWTWYMLLEKNGEQLRCYAYHYRLSPDPLAVNVALMAQTYKDAVTVRGRLYKDGLELDRIIYKSYDIDTNYPFRYHYPYMLRH